MHALLIQTRQSNDQYKLKLHIHTLCITNLLAFIFKPGWCIAGFLKLIRCGCLYACVFVCVSALRLSITNGVIWTPNDWLNKFYSCYIATLVGLGIDTYSKK